MGSINDRVLLDEILKEERAERAPEMDDGAFFEVFVADQALKDAELAYEDILRGVVDGGRDGGVDAIYTFVDGELIRDEAEIARRRATLVELVIIQAKRDTSFTEDPVNALIPTFRHLLPLETGMEQYKSRYKPAVREGFALFRKAVRDTVRSRPAIHLRLVYGCRAVQLSPGVVESVEELEAVFKEQFSDGVFRPDFLGASELLAHFRREALTNFDLDVAEFMDPNEPGIVALVRLDAFNRLISGSDGALRNALFDANVRDYQGKVRVNQEIYETLRDARTDEFWWFNNGVTVLVGEMSSRSKTLTFSNPSIVNGLQTSYEINRYFKDEKPQKDPRHVLVRFLDITDETTRDRIIRATNSQTRIPIASLRATDPVHRDIEEILKPAGLYYERRKNYYKNQGRPIRTIISINYVAQAVMAMLLQRSNDSRARPGTLLSKDADYTRVFSRKYPIGMYRTATELMRRVDEFLAAKTDLSRNQRTNYRFHLAMVAATAPDGRRLAPRDLASIDPASWTDDHLEDALRRTKRGFRSVRRSTERSRDEVSKGPDIVRSLLRSMRRSEQ